MRANGEHAGLEALLRKLKLPSFLACYRDAAEQAEKNGWGFEQFLQHLAEQEIHDRERRRIERLLRQSNLPLEKSLATLKPELLTQVVRRRLPHLCEGEFVARAENVLAFGLPGRGKTHLCCAIGHELVKRGIAVLFMKTYELVQRLLRARRDLVLERELSKLDHFDVVILDDIGYVQQEREEMEVLFTFLAERYERRSVVITSNLVFSQWDRIFKDPMTTQAAIDRLVHHAVILELKGPSIRNEDAKRRKAEESDSP